MPTTKTAEGPPFVQVKLSTFETDDSTVAAEQMFALHGAGARLEHVGGVADFSTRVEAASFGAVTLAKHEAANWSYTRKGRKNIRLTLVLDSASACALRGRTFIAISVARRAPICSHAGWTWRDNRF